MATITITILAIALVAALAYGAYEITKSTTGVTN